MNIHTLLMVLSRRSVVVFLAAMVFGTALPAAASPSLLALFRTEGATMVAADGTSVVLRRSYTPQDRYDYNRALEIYNLYLQKGKTGLTKPDINIRSTIDLYLDNPIEDSLTKEVKTRTDPYSTVDYVKPPVDTPAEQTLSAAERAALRRAEKTGTCWQYKGFSDDFYTQCQKIIKGKEGVRTIGIQTDLIYSRTEGRKYLMQGSSSSRLTHPLTVKDYNYFSSAKSSRRGRAAASSSAQ